MRRPQTLVGEQFWSVGEGLGGRLVLGSSANVAEYHHHSFTPDSHYNITVGRVERPYGPAGNGYYIVTLSANGTQ